MKPDKHDIDKTLRMLATKGTYETLLYIKDNEYIGYNAILKHVTSNKIVASRASIHKTITDLSNMKLLERKITQDRPVRTGYRVNERGHKVIKCLDEIYQATR